MPPFCEKHGIYHDDYHDCQTMTRAAERRKAEKARADTAERIANEHMEAFTIRDGDVEECSAGYVRDLLIAAVRAGMDAR